MIKKSYLDKFSYKYMKDFKDFNESISGTELIGSLGPASGSQKLPTTINYHDTNIIFCDLNSKFYTIDEYTNLYQDYLKNGGSPLDGFTLDNIITILNQ